MTRVPSFLIIGAMRAGTTTIFQDLEPHPEIFMPENKEPELLCMEGAGVDKILRRYALLFRRARPAQICAEASTAYTKCPDYLGVPGSARQICGLGLKLLYVVRDPIARARSAHHHDTALGEMSLPIDSAMRSEPRFLNYSRYAMQLESWLEEYPPEQFFVVRLEDYIKNREKWAKRICNFLEIDPSALPTPSEKAFNKAMNRPTSSGFWRRYVHRQHWYEHYVKPTLPRGLRRGLAGFLLPKAAPAAEPLAADTVRWMVDELGSDTERFEALFREMWSDNYDPVTRYDLRTRYLSAAA